jgi:hypothetical protein
VADLRVEQQVLTQAEGAFREAANRMAPVARTLNALDTSAAGAAVLADAFTASRSRR